MRIGRTSVALAAALLQPAFAQAVCPSWPFPTYVSLAASNGRFVAAEGGGGRHLVANRSVAGAWEKFKLAAVDGGALGWGKRASLQGWGGQFVVAPPGDILRDNRNAVGAWETFIIENVPRPYNGDCSWMKIRLKAVSTGSYVSAVSGGGGNLVSNVSTPGASETFAMRGQSGALDLSNEVPLVRHNTPGNGNATWKRVSFGDICSSALTEDGSGVVLLMNCGRSWVKGKVEVEVFRNTELKNGWHIIWFQVNRGFNNDTTGIVVLQHPADSPVGDINPFTKFTAECPARSACGFTVMTFVKGPKNDPMF